MSLPERYRSKRRPRTVEDLFPDGMDLDDAAELLQDIRDSFERKRKMQWVFLVGFYLFAWSLFEGNWPGFLIYGGAATAGFVALTRLQVDKMMRLEERVAELEATNGA